MTVSARRRPAAVSGTLAVAFGLAALALLATDGVPAALAVEGAGLAGVAAGLTVGHRRSRIAGALVAALALCVVVAALAMVVGRGDLLTGAQFLPGMVGVLVLAFGVVPLRGTGSRQLVNAGAGLLFLAVCTAGVVQRPALTTLLVSGAATVLAWDAGENAVGVGTQLGRRAVSWRGEGVHLVGTALVAGVAVLAAHFARGVRAPSITLGGFVLLLIGLGLLALALHD